MQVIQAGRGVGKTFAMVEWARATGGVVLTFNEREAARLRKLYPDVRFIAANNRRQLAGLHVSSAFDNLDLWLASLFPGLKIATMTKDEDEPDPRG